MSVPTRHLSTVARLVLGSAFLVFGLNGFLNFIPLPEHPAPAQAFLGALAATGYMFPLIKGTEVLAGLALISGRYVPLALVVLMPITVNIVAFHAAFEPATLGMPLILLALQLAIVFTQRQSYLPLLRARHNVAETSDRTAPQETLAAL